MIDTKISGDFTALGRASRAGVASLDDMMAVVGGERPAMSIEEQVKQLPQALAYARQAWRTAWCGTALAWVAILLVLMQPAIGEWLQLQTRNLEPHASLSSVARVEAANWLFEANARLRFSFIVVTACAIAGLAFRRAIRRFDDLGSERALARESWWPVAIQIAGSTCLTAYTVGLLALSSGEIIARTFNDHLRAIDVSLLSTVAVALSCVVARARADSRIVRWLEHRATLGAAIFVLVAGVVGTFRIGGDPAYDVDWFASATGWDINGYDLRRGLTIAMTCAAFALLASRAVRTRAVRP